MKRAFVFFIIVNLYACIAYGQENNGYTAEYFHYCMVKNGKDSIPIIIYNDKEITAEECAKIPAHKINTSLWLTMPLSERAIGERGRKRDVMYLHEKPEHIPPFPGEWEFFRDRNTELESEFPGGEDSMYVFVRNSIEIPDELDSIKAFVEFMYYTDKYGNRVRVEPLKIFLVNPEEVEFRLLNGKMAHSDLTSDKGKRVLELLRETAVNVANKFPQFQPANCWLQDVPFAKRIRISVAGPNSPKERANFIY